MNVAFFDTRSFDKPAFEKYGNEMGVSYKFFETKLTEDTVRLCAGFDAVCVFVNDTVDAAVLDKLYAYGVQLLALRCAGYNNVDVRHAYGKVHIVRVPAYSPYAVAEHTMAMLLTSIRRIHKAYIRTKDFNFSLDGLTGFDLHGKTAGVIGTGRIGRIFADICKGFGMRVLAHDPHPSQDGALAYVPLDTLFAESDILSLNCPLTEDSYHLINEQTIAQMKKGVVLLNTSRGALIDAQALLQGIKDRQVGAACLDVYEEESDIFFEDFSGHIVQDDTLARLISMPNVLVTSHQAFLTQEALDSIAKTTTENICTFQKTGGSPNELCYHCGKTDDCRQHRLEKCF